MGSNVTFLGDVADDYDESVAEAQHILDNWVEKGNYSTFRMATASSVIAFMVFSQSFVDSLKVGNGIATGTWKGAAMDGLRILNFTGTAGAIYGRASRLLVVAQKAGTFTCTWISTVNAIRRTGQRFFISLTQLAKTAGVDLEVINLCRGTPLAELSKLQAALGKLGIPCTVLRHSKNVGEIVNQLQRYPKSVMVFAVRAIKVTKQGRGPVAHQMMATFCKGVGLIIKDTDGTVFKGMDAFLKVYTEAEMFREYSFIIPNSALMNLANEIQPISGLATIILEVMPLEFGGSKTPVNPEDPGHKAWVQRSTIWK